MRNPIVLSYRALLMVSCLLTFGFPAFAGTYVKIASTNAAPNPSGGRWTRMPPDPPQEGDFLPNQQETYADMRKAGVYYRSGNEEQAVVI